MSVALHQPMSRDEFLLWAEQQEEPYEFDGVDPVLMTRGTIGHSRIIIALLRVIADRLAGKPFEVLGPEAGIATTGSRVRYPDVLISSHFAPDTDRLVSDAVAVFEVVSPSSSRMDRIVKLREYGAVDSIRTYVILETDTDAAMQFDKQADGTWAATALTTADSIALPLIGIEIPLLNLYPGSTTSSES